MRAPRESALLTDLCQLTMLQAYWQHQMDKVAVFELFVRQLPGRRRAFMVAAGLEQALEFIEHARFEKDDLDWIEASGRFAPGFTTWLSRLRFTGDVWAMREGTIFFPGEPILRVTAPIGEAQWLESRLLNLVHLQTMVASKAARMVLAARVHDLVDFGMRRAHGAESAVLAARASFIGGFAGTTTTLAGARFGIPLHGTMAHSWIQAHDSEAIAFASVLESHPKNAVLLLDTYDTEAAARCVARVAPRLAGRGLNIKGVSLEGGDLLRLSRLVRAQLDDAGLHDVAIVVTGNLDEYRIADLVAAGAPIDSYGIGTSAVTSYDAPALDAVYELQEYAGLPRSRQSPGNATWPGRKQVWRRHDADGCFSGDLIGLETERGGGEPLLQPVMRGGRCLAPPPSLEQVRRHCREQLAALPAALRSLRGPRVPYRVQPSSGLQRLAERADGHQPLEAEFQLIH